MTNQSQNSKVGSIDDPIAEDYWSYISEDGTKRLSRVVVSRPRPNPDDENGDWSCSVYFEHVTPEVLTFFGIGPVDALMNAMRFIDTQFFKMNEVTPRAQR